MKKTKIHRFEYRFGTELLRLIKTLSKELCITKSALMRRALKEAGEYYACGAFHYRTKSDFLCRKKISDKIRFELSLDTDEREVLRKLAFTWRISQAEVMRMVVEHFIYVLNGKNLKKKRFYVQKIRYNRPKAAVMLVTYDIINVVEARYMMFRPPKRWKTLVA